MLNRAHPLLCPKPQPCSKFLSSAATHLEASVALGVKSFPSPVLTGHRGLRGPASGDSFPSPGRISSAQNL